MSRETADDDVVWAVAQRTQNLHLLSGWPYKGRFRRRVGRREGHQQWQEPWRLG